MIHLARLIVKIATQESLHCFLHDHLKDTSSRTIDTLNLEYLWWNDTKCALYRKSIKPHAITNELASSDIHIKQLVYIIL